MHLRDLLVEVVLFVALTGGGVAGKKECQAQQMQMVQVLAEPEPTEQALAEREPPERV